MARLAQHSDIAPRIIIDNHGHVRLPLVVLFDRFDGRYLSREGDVEHIAALPWAQTDAVPRFDFDAVDHHGHQRWLIFEQIEFPLVHRSSSRAISVLALKSAGVMPRNTPCNFMKCSVGMDSVRSSTSRARASLWRISRFSSSLSVRILSAKISSISVPSNRSPWLSGAICG